VKCIHIGFISPIFFLLMALQCTGNLALTNGYEYDVVVYTVYDNGTDTVERRDNFYQEKTFYVAGKGHIEYSNITAIRIETPEGIMLVEYPSEYPTKLREVYKKNGYSPRKVYSCKLMQ